MHIWLITVGEQLPIKQHIRKLRTAYLADELLSRGHSVLWWASAFDHFKKKWLFDNDTEVDINENFKIKMLKGKGYKKNISFSRFLDHRIIAKKFKKMAAICDKPDIIVVSMPTYDLAYEAVNYGHQNKIPVLVDIRDQWPDIFIDKSPLPKPITRAIFTSEFNMLKKVMRGAKGIISVTNTFMNWGLQYASRSKTHADKVFYLGYKKHDQVKLINNSAFEQIIDSIKHKFVVTFIGTFEEFHDPSILVECAKVLKNDKSIHFVLAGDGKFKSVIEQNSLGLDNITLTGWLQQDQIDLLLQESDVGMCTSKKTADLFPNKAFSYFAHGLPIISSFQGDLKKIIDEARVGFYYPPGEIKTLVEKITTLQYSRDLYLEYSQNAKSLFENELDGTIIYKNYAEHIETMALS